MGQQYNPRVQCYVAQSIWHETVTVDLEGVKRGSSLGAFSRDSSQQMVCQVATSFNDAMEFQIPSSVRNMQDEALRRLVLEREKQGALYTTMKL